jgi:hypothetical protein
VTAVAAACTARALRSRFAARVRTRGSAHVAPPPPLGRVRRQGAVPLAQHRDLNFPPAFVEEIVMRSAWAAVCGWCEPDEAQRDGSCRLPAEER